MSENKHTPEPWKVKPGMASAIKSADNLRWIAFQMKDADALRIVACVNACEGIDDPAQFVQNMRSDNRDLLQRLGNAMIENEALRAEIEALKAFNESKLMEHPSYAASKVWKKDPES